jgi:hypothetical protein
MNRKDQISLVVCIAVILAIAFTWYYAFIDMKSFSEDQNKKIADNKVVEEYGEFTLSAIDSENISVCNKINNSTLSDLCKMYVATATKDESVCASLEERISNLCFFHVAEVLSNASLCDKIVDVNSSARCQGIVKGGLLNNLTAPEPSACELFNDSSKRVGCYMLIEQLSNDPKACDLIKDKGAKTTCYAEIKSRNKARE